MKQVKYIAAVILLLVSIIVGGSLLHNCYLNYRFGLKAKLIASVSSDKLIDESLKKLIEKYPSFCDIKNSDKLNTVFKDIDFSIFPPNDVILIVYGRMIDLEASNKLPKDIEYTPREDQRYTGYFTKPPETKNTFYLYTYNSKGCMLYP